MIRTIACLALVTMLASNSAVARQGDRSSCPSRSSSDYYFATGDLEPRDALADLLSRNSYSAYLTAMKEPSLSCGHPGGPTYRFLLLGSFAHPIAVRVSGTEYGVSLVAVELDEAGGFSPGKLKRRRATFLQRDQLRKIENALSTANFWSMPTTVERHGKDGATWILEGVVDRKYHLITRWTPEHDDPVRAIGELFLSIAKWKGKRASD